MCQLFNRRSLLPCHCDAGSGKTHTLIGDISSTEDKGLLPRAVNAIANGVAQCTDGSYFQVILLRDVLTMLQSILISE